jgi:hypothetical protein
MANDRQGGKECFLISRRLADTLAIVIRSILGGTSESALKVGHVARRFHEGITGRG